MNVHELYEVTIWVETEIVNAGIQDQYTQLINVLSQNVNQRNNQPLQPFDKQKKSLIDTLRKVQVFRLSREQKKVLEKAQMYQQIGSDSADEIEKIFIEKGVDLATILKELQTKKKKLDSGITLINTIKKDLSAIIDDEHIEVEPGNAIIKVHFQYNSQINNIVDLRKWSNDWYEIARGIALSQDDVPESIKVLSAEKGSIIIKLGVSYGIVELVSKLILRVLEVVEKSLEIKKTALEIKNLELENKKIEQELEREAEKHKENALKNIPDEFISGLPDGEKKTALVKAIDKLIEFTEKGGEVDCYIPSNLNNESNELSEEVTTINNNFKQIRRIETTIQQIEYFD